MINLPSYLRRPCAWRDGYQHTRIRGCDVLMQLKTNLQAGYDVVAAFRMAMYAAVLSPFLIVVITPQSLIPEPVHVFIRLKLDPLLLPTQPSLR